MIKKIQVFFSLCMLASSVFATDYYVSKTGDNANSGTEEAPFLTITKAASIMVAGDVCIIKAGVYRETVSPANAGSAGNPIVFKAFEGDTVVVSATELVTNWALHSGNIYSTQKNLVLGEVQNMLYADGQVMDIARWPNNVDNDPQTIDAEPIDNGSLSHIERTTIPAIDWTGAYVWYLGAHSGASWTRPITASSSGRIDFAALQDKWPFNPHNPTVFRNNNRGRMFLFGKLAALDHPREWFYDKSKNTIYFNAPNNANPNELVVEVAFRDASISLNKSYIVIDGLHVFGGRVDVKADDCVIKNCVIRYGHQALDELNNTDAQDSKGSITIEASNTLIDHNLLENGSANGVAMLTAWKGSTNNTVNNNIIRGFNTVGIHANPIRSNTANMTATNNTIYRTGRDGMYNSGSNGVIAYNDLYDCMRINNDAGVFYTVGNANDKNTVIHHNWFHDSSGPFYADGRAAGIYLDNHSKGYIVHHNVIWNITWAGIQINWDNWNIDIYNNSIYESESAMGRWENGYTIDDIVLKNNYASKPSTRGNNDNQQYVINGWIGTDVSSTTNIISADSPFESIEDHNFMPVSGSALIDKGEVIAGITDGHSGSKPDIGAYEFGGESWVAGADWEALETVVIEEEEEEEEEEEILGLKLGNRAFVVGPNPVRDRLYVRFSENKPVEPIAMLDMQGRKLPVQPLQHEAGLQLDMRNVPKGMYLLILKTADGEQHVMRILKPYN